MNKTALLLPLLALAAGAVWLAARGCGADAGDALPASAREVQSFRLTPEMQEQLAVQDKMAFERISFSVARKEAEPVVLTEELNRKLFDALKKQDAARLPSGKGEIFELVANGRGMFQIRFLYEGEGTNNVTIGTRFPKWELPNEFKWLNTTTASDPATFCELSRFAETNMLEGTIAMRVFRPASDPATGFVLMQNDAEPAEGIAACRVPGLGDIIEESLGLALAVDSHTEKSTPATPLAPAADESHAEDAEGAEP